MSVSFQIDNSGQNRSTSNETQFSAKYDDVFGKNAMIRDILGKEIVELLRKENLLKDFYPVLESNDTSFNVANMTGNMMIGNYKSKAHLLIKCKELGTGEIKAVAYRLSYISRKNTIECLPMTGIGDLITLKDLLSKGGWEGLEIFR